MGKKTCENCEQTIGNLEESFLYKNRVVCKACKTLLEDESQAIETTNSNAKAKIPIAEILPQVVANIEHESTADPIQQNEQKKEYGGIGRTGYFLGMFAIAFVGAISDAAAQREPGMVSFGPGPIIAIAFAFFIVINRLKNIGRSGWWSLLILVPIANLFVGIPCAIFPEGYQDTKKLDTAGKIIACIFIGLVVLGLVCVVIGSLSS